jgi:putative acyl-CoA dehydrogenase
MKPTPFPNQPEPYGNRNLYLDDAALREGVRREGGAFADDALIAWGETLGRDDVLALGDAANRRGPELRNFDARGERVDEVDFDPAWDALMQMSKAAGEHCSPWSQPREGAHVARAAHALVHGQVENGTQCPITMTHAAIPVLQRFARAVPAFDEVWLPRLFAREHDPRSLPVDAKRGALIGMGMTERQGGSDVRSNRTRAEADVDGAFRITGHKWFFSAPQSDAHLVLAQDDDGLSCFFMPRFDTDGQRNRIRVNRLKDKLGNRSNASSEVEFEGAEAWRIGAPAHGVATILEMVRYTRLDCVLGSASIMRGALARAVHYARHRVAFGALLVDQPLMRNVLADLALEVEAATALALRLARAFEAAPGSSEHALAQVVTPAAKFWVCKRTTAFTAEAMEALGGNGYVEASAMPRLHREAPVNSIWEGSGNVMCLDVLRALQREPQALDALRAEIARARGGHRAFDAALARFESLMAHGAGDPASARIVAQGIAVLLQAALLLQHAPGVVADAFCASRCGDGAFGGAVFGTLPTTAASGEIVARALP